MFTGLVEEMGRVESVSPVPEGVCLRVAAPHAAEDLEAGGSIAVSGVCQTVIAAGPHQEGRWFEMIAIPETLARTTFGTLEPGSQVNLERPLRIGDRLGGHWVQGHVDATGRIEQIQRHGQDRAYSISLPRALAPYVVEKGSIAVDGVSLTIGIVEDEPEETRFWVHIIPETLARTRFALYEEGNRVNLEVDILAKYVLRAALFQNVSFPGGATSPSRRA
jgi:riboflavin synthase